MARFGYLMQHRGRWQDRQLISEQWITWALAPTPVEPSYGFMNFYNNKDGKYLPRQRREHGLCGLENMKAPRRAP